MELDPDSGQPNHDEIHDSDGQPGAVAVMHALDAELIEITNGVAHADEVPSDLVETAPLTMEAGDTGLHTNGQVHNDAPPNFLQDGGTPIGTVEAGFRGTKQNISQ